MKIVIIGPGNLGKLFTAFLTLLGADATLMGKSSRESCLDLYLLSQFGLEVETVGSVWDSWGFAGKPEPLFYVTPKVFINSARYTQSFDLAIVLVKGPATAEAAKQAAIILKPDGVCLTLQNGLGNAEILATVLGAKRVYQGITALGATAQKSGTGVVWAGWGQTAFGQDSPQLTELATLLEMLRLPVLQTDTINSLIWAKLIVNSAINPLTALTSYQNGQLLDDPLILQKLDALALESAQIAQAAGIELPFPIEFAAEHVRNVARQTAPNTSSMLSDVRNNRPTEIETINGAIIRKAQQIGQAAPLNQSIYEAVKKLEASFKPRPEPQFPRLPPGLFESALYREWQELNP